jgi:hypothetical protein
MREQSISGTRSKLEAWLIECDETLRKVSFNQPWASPKKRDAEDGEEKEITVVDCLLADRQGPIMASMWGEAGEELVRIRKNVVHGAARPLLRFEHFRVTPVKDSSNAKILTPMTIIHSVKTAGVQIGTQIVVSLSPLSPYTSLSQQFRVPEPRHCISVFQRMRALLEAPPHRGTFKGVVLNAKAIDTTAQGKAKLCFEIVDNEGTAIPVVAVGRCADEKVIMNGAEIVMFNGAGRAGVGAYEGSIYLFKEALVVPLGKKKDPVAKVRSINL